MIKTVKTLAIILFSILALTGSHTCNADDSNQFTPQKIDYGPDHVWTGPDGRPLPFNTLDDTMAFLAVAEPIHTEIIRSGVRRPVKYLLKKDGVEVNAIFRHESRVDNSSSPAVGTAKGSRYFRDCYKSEIAAFEVNRLLGLNNMPPTIFRSINRKKGTLQLWAEGTMTDKKRAKEKILPPNEPSWNKQMWDTQVFDNLINNIDRNQGNILIDSNWRLILIDHTQSFSRDVTLPNPEKVTHCSRGLWHNLRHLDEAVVQNLLEPYLNRMEMNSFFKRREKLIELIQGLIDKKGEENVLF
ncbi:MAG: hypothetical protein GX654_20420 [Desulfatiglans sp.]|nr:hypothetical protein [Desulfatiglans sp.]